MPILDVSVGDEPIISGGVVSAEGYDPIIITETEENKAKDSDSQKSKDEAPVIEIKEEKTLFGFDMTTVIFTSIFFFLVFGLFIASCFKGCKTEIPEPRKSDRSKVYQPQELAQDSTFKEDLKKPE